ncbi:MAG: thioredoxin family protein [Saprospiraceae bacterium]|nr:thioredoxin family protein [Saprospiraceae bacterium]
MKQVTLLLGTLLILALVLTSAKIVSEGGYALGDKADDFKLQSVDGSWITLSEYAEEGAIVIFTCNTCPWAKLYEDRIIELHKEFTSQGFPVLAINPNDPEIQPGDSFDAMKIRSEEKGFPFPYVIDAEQKVYPKFGATRTPHVFLLASDLTVQYIGGIDDSAQDASGVSVNYVAKAIAAVKEGKTPDPATTKAIGCGIKAKRS